MDIIESLNELKKMVVEKPLSSQEDVNLKILELLSRIINEIDRIKILNLV